MATILVIDDERLLCDLLKEVLSRQGHEVWTAYSGKEGLAQHASHHPQFTLLDLRLNDMHGIEVLREIRRRDSKAPVIVLTGGCTEQQERDVRELGVTDFLVKGLPPDALMKAVASALQSHPAAASQDAKKSPTILVADDELSIRNLLNQFLTQRGYRVHLAHDGPTALAMAEREQPNLMVLDIGMPGMNGVEVLRTLRSRSYAGGVMMLTGSQDTTLLKEALNLGSIDIIGKPADLERIGLAIDVSLILAAR